MLCFFHFIPAADDDDGADFFFQPFIRSRSVVSLKKLHNEWNSPERTKEKTKHFKQFRLRWNAFTDTTMNTKKSKKNMEKLFTF